MRPLVWGLALGAMACSGGAETNCSDGLDDDKDGLIDQFDSDCSSTPAADDTDTDDATSEGPFIFDGLQSQTLTVDVAIAVRQLGAGIDDENPFCNDMFNICDCTLHLSGDGDYLSGHDSEGVFLGDWILSSTDCNEGLLGAVWYSLPGRSVYHTYRWSDDGSTHDEWIVHEDEEEDDPVPEADSPSSHHQFYVSQMSTSYDESSGTADYVEEGSTDDPSSMTTTFVTTTFSVDFD